MGLTSFFKRHDDKRRETADVAPSDAVQGARTQARRRLIGAAVLVAVGVIVFPLLFETTPRPIAVDIPIVIPPKQGAAPPALPAPRAAVAQGTVTQPPAPATTAPSAAIITERAGEQGREIPAPQSPRTEAEKPGPKAQAKVETKPEVKPAAKTEPQASAARPEAPKAPVPRPEATKPEATRPELAKPVPGAAASAAEAGRFVVQVGAFGEVQSARDARQKLEKLGLKTYTQEVEVNGQRRIRVRAGPYASRAEAEKAAVTIKGSGLPAALLTL